MSIHQAQMIPEWGAVTFFTNGAIDARRRRPRRSAARGVTIEETPIARLEGHAEIVLADGRNSPSPASSPRPTPRPPPRSRNRSAASTWKRRWASRSGPTTKETTVPGAFACGDVAKMPHSVSLAVADGAWAGANIHRTLIFSVCEAR
jgi:thioredoxin reductase